MQQTIQQNSQHDLNSHVKIDERVRKWFPIDTRDHLIDKNIKAFYYKQK